jgi:hypothetical protein
MAEIWSKGYYEVPAERLTVGMVINDERFRHVMKVGHVTIGPKWVTARSFHPDANVYPKTAYRFARGDLATVERSSLPADYFGAPQREEEPRT